MESGARKGAPFRPPPHPNMAMYRIWSHVSRVSMRKMLNMERPTRPKWNGSLPRKTARRYEQGRESVGAQLLGRRARRAQETEACTPAPP